jgi:hypothetical protein
MKNVWLKLTAVCAACSLYSAPAWAQKPSQTDRSHDDLTPSENTVSKDVDNQRDKESDSSQETTISSSSRHLSATGRQNTPQRVSKVIGAPVNDASGNQIGQIEDILVTPGTGKIDFAVVSLSGSTSESRPGASASTSGKLIPVPWSLLKTPSSESSASEGQQQPRFTLNVDQSKLSQAPEIDRSSWSNVSESNWRQRVYSHYGVSESATGSAESPSGTTQGSGAHKLTEPSGSSDNPQ